MTTKTCNKCGDTKPVSEFYVNKRLQNGNVVYKSHCKVCVRKRVANKKRKSNQPYRTIKEVQQAKVCGDCGGPREAGVRKCAECRRKAAKRRAEERHCKLEDPWTKAILSAVKQLRQRERNLSEDPWARKINSILTGVQRRNRFTKPKIGSRNKIRHTSFDSAVSTAARRLTQKAKRLDQPPFERKMESIARNWRRRVNGT